MSLPKGQDWFILRMQKMGYASSSKGVCFGLSHMAMQAILADEIDVFDERLEKINSLSLDSIAQTINDLKDKRTKTKNLPIDPLLEIPVFFEGVELYHQAYLYPFLFEEEKKPTVQDAMASAPLILPQVLKENNIEINKPAIFTGAYNQEELIDHFQSLRSAIQQSDPPLLKPFTMILTSGNHAITVAYDPRKDEWLFIDPNELPTQHIQGSNNIIAKKVLSAFSDNGITTFSTEIYTTNTNKAAIEVCINNWKNQEAWKKIHTVSINNVAMVDSFNTSWLHIAAQNGDLETVKALLAKNANVNLACTDGTTALYIAAQFGQLETVKTLLDAGADVDLDTPTGTTPLYVAAQEGHLEVVKALLAKNARVDLPRIDATTALYVAAKNGHLEIVKALLDAGAEIDFDAATGATALFVAAENGHLEVVKALLAKNANVDLACTDGTTALYIAAQNGHLEVVKALLAKNAKVDLACTSGATALYIAAQEGKLEIVKALLNAKANANLVRTDGSTALLIAAEKGHVEIVKALLDAGANVNRARANGTTALFIAAEKGHFEVVKVLLDAGVDVNLARTDSATALFIATQKRHLDITRLLLSKGAKVDAAVKGDTLSLHAFAKEYNVESRMNDLIKKKPSTSIISITCEEMITVMDYSEMNETLINFKKLEKFVLSLRNIANTYYSPTLFHSENKEQKINIDKIIDATNEAYRSFANGTEIDEIINTLRKTTEISLDTKKDYSKESLILFTKSELAAQINTPLNKVMS